MEALSSEKHKRIYYKSIKQKLNDKIRETGITQKELAEECIKRNISATQGSISKLLSGSESGQSMSLITVAALCAILELDMNDVLSFDSARAESDAGSAPDFDKDYIYSSDTLISDPGHTAFKGYAGVCLDIYFYPTIAIESELIKGTLTFEKDTRAKLCRVTMTIDTDRVHKIYTGILRISLQQNACYVILSSRELGEISTIFFRHRFFSASTLRIRLACCCTVSAGENRRPTVHRAVLSEVGKELTAEDMKLIRSQLLLNDSQIRISRKNMEALMQGDGIYSAISEKAIEEESVMVFEENDVLSLQGYTLEQTARALTEMRLASFGAQRYNKSSAKSDDLLFNRLF